MDFFDIVGILSRYKKTAGPEGIRDADLMYMSKNLNQRIQESYERSSAQVTFAYARGG